MLLPALLPAVNNAFIFQDVPFKQLKQGVFTQRRRFSIH